MKWLRRWRAQRDCFHHNQSTGATWIGARLINTGANKVFKCMMCGRMWFV